jgi:EAL domain-containing protein (putative c-di-GMP-specific phosphodiesterase class I)
LTAEALGLMHHVDHAVVQAILSGLVGHVSVKTNIFAMNISALSFVDDDLRLDIVELIKCYNIDPKILCFEITETARIPSLAYARRFVETFRAMGAQVAIDDFGTGEASFHYLKELNPTMIKINGASIHGMVSDELTREWAKFILRHCRRHGLLTVAEQIETERHMKTAKSFAFDYGQGFFLNMPQLWPLTPNRHLIHPDARFASQTALAGA